MSESDDLEILAVDLVDLRATVEAMRRSVTNAQGSVEQFRHTCSQEQLTDIANCLATLAEEARTVTESTADAQRALAALRAPDGAGPGPGRERGKPAES